MTYRVLIAEAREHLSQVYVSYIKFLLSFQRHPKIDYNPVNNVAEADRALLGDERLIIIGHLHRTQKHTQEPTARNGLEFARHINELHGGYGGIVLAVDDNEVLKEARTISHGSLDTIYCTDLSADQKAGEKTLARLLEDLPNLMKLPK